MPTPVFPISMVQGTLPGRPRPIRYQRARTMRYKPGNEARACGICATRTSNPDSPCCGGFARRIIEGYNSYYYQLTEYGTDCRTVGLVSTRIYFRRMAIKKRKKKEDRENDWYSRGEFYSVCVYVLLTSVCVHFIPQHFRIGQSGESGCRTTTC